MSSKSRLDIPEFMDIVASHLNERDFAHCLLVSKSWRDMFPPRVWRRIHRRFSPTVDGGRDISGPEQETLHNHRHFVQELSIEGPIEAKEMCTHLNLRTLSINKRMYGRMAEHDSPSTLGWDLAKKAPLLTIGLCQCEPTAGPGIVETPSSQGSVSEPGRIPTR
ncbi:MAG: hypothetical protein J3Q66DRAFT_375756 [Benniella sp.]|nr:MAG: hypothetical protein J3Q66DRAFT_375756 [Benniella sp.]